MTITTAFETAFWSALTLLIYAYFVYPLLMATIAGRSKVTALDGNSLYQKKLPSVAVLVAAFNEEKHIAARIENLLQQDYPREKLQIIVGSDGSSDGTAEIARKYAAPRTVVHEFRVNRGKASVLNDLVARASADVLVFTDANTVFNADTVRQLVLALNAQTSAVCGELILEARHQGNNQDHQYWNFERRLKAAESNIGGLLGANGGVYAIHRACYQPLRPDTICDDFVIAMNIAVAGKGLRYIPAAAAFEDTPTDMVAEFHRRVRIGIGNYQALFRHPQYLFGGSWALSFTYFSHKVLRWLTPHLLILVLASSIFLAGTSLYKLAAVSQLLGYAAAIAVFWLRNRYAWPKSIRAALLFATLNLAFLVAFKRFLAADYSGSWRRTERA